MPLSIFANKVQEKKENTQQAQSLIETESLGAKVAVNIHSQGEKLNGIEGKMDTIESSMGNALKDLDEISRNNSSFGFSSLFSLFDSKSAPAPASTSDLSSTQTSSAGDATATSEVQPSPLKRLGNALDPVLGLLNTESVKRMMKIGDTQTKDETAQIDASVGTIQNMAIDTRSAAAVQNEQLDGLDVQVDATNARIQSATSRVEKLLKK